MLSNHRLELRFAESLAREAGRLMQRERARGFDVSLKGKNDLVTTIDQGVETFVRDAIQRTYPDDTILGEEQGTTQRDEGRMWVVDPIDGTMNFVSGIPFYCVSIALREGDEAVVGAIYDPNRDELFSGRRGVAPTLDGQAMACTTVEHVSESIVATGFAPPRGGQPEDNLSRFVEVTRRCRGIRRLGSAALDLAYVAAGRLEAFWEFHLNPWDTGAGALLVELAGGKVTDVNGNPSSGFDSSILATNGPIHDELVEILRTP